MNPRNTPFGIDLGTTYSVVAQLDSKGIPRTVSNAEGDLTTPSVVLFDKERIVVGKEALKAATIEPERIAQFAKREMGNPLFPKEINGEYFPPEVIQSLILEKLKQDTIAKVGHCDGVVITVPAYFNETRRKATQDAGRMAGLEVLDIINEPTAAAIAFGIQEGFLDGDGNSLRKETILVYDLGGGTFDVSVLSIDGRHYKVLATDGNFMLGGIDWDGQIVDMIADQFIAEHFVDPRKSPSGYQRLLREAEDAKRTLSTREKAMIPFEHAGNAIRIDLTRAEFEMRTANLVDRTRFTTKKVLGDARLHWTDLSRILLVGGSTRMPMVSKMLREETGIEPDQSLAADEAVAHGAAIYANLLRKAEQKSREFTVTNVNAHALGVLGVELSTKRKRTRVVLDRNTPLPAKKSAVFQTVTDSQPSVAVNIVEGGDSSGHNSAPIGKCVIRNLPPSLPSGTPVVVTFSYAANGRLKVKAVLPSLKKRATVEIERTSCLSDAKVDEWGRRIRNQMKPIELENSSEPGERT